MTTTDIEAIRRLLAEDIARAKIADQDAAAVRDKLNDDHNPERSTRRLAELRMHQARASEARQSFSARTEMLQHLDLGDVTPDELIAAATSAPGGGVDPDATGGRAPGDPNGPHRVAGIVGGQTPAQTRAVFGEPDWNSDQVVRLCPRTEDRGPFPIRDYVLPPEAAGPGSAARTIDQDVRDFLDTHHR